MDRYLSIHNHKIPKPRKSSTCVQSEWRTWVTSVPLTRWSGRRSRREAGSVWADEEIPSNLWHSKVHHRVHKSPPSWSDLGSDEWKTHLPILFLPHPLQYPAIHEWNCVICIVRVRAGRPTRTDISVISLMTRTETVPETVGSSSFNPYPAKRGEYGELLPTLTNGRWDLIRRLKG